MTTTSRQSLPRSSFNLALITLVALCLSACGGPKSVASGNGNAVVERVVDGDTIVVNYNHKSEKVRLIGIDTPETVDPRRPTGCFGLEASNFTKSLLPKGTELDLKFDVEQRDKYGRLLAYVYRASDGLFVDAELVRQGYANLLTIPPNVAHVDEFRLLATQAREQNRGLWAACGNVTLNS